MKFLEKYEATQLDDGSVLFEKTPVENYSEIFVCANKVNDVYTIFDGGSTLSALNMIYIFSSPEFLEKFIGICQQKRISKKDNVLFVECYEQDFEQRLNDFVEALNMICEI